jgi:hypothetical protein
VSLAQSGMSKGARCYGSCQRKEYAFASPYDISVDLLAGPSPIRLGAKHCKSFAITSDKYAFLAGRFVRPGRLVLFEASLRDTHGTEALVIHRSGLGLCRCSFTPLPQS